MVAVFNFGGQYAHLIARRIRELGIKSELVSPDIKISELKKLKPNALVFSGSPYSVYVNNSPKPSKSVYDLKLPILGICYGQQLMAFQLRGKVTSHEDKQFGKETLQISKSPLFVGLSKKEIVWFSHGDQVDKLPTGFDTIGTTKNAKIAAIQNKSKKFFGIQFHPEVNHTPKGNIVLSNFLFKISKVKKDWNIKDVKNQIVKKLKNQIGSEKVLMALSGGVDSTVAATLIRQAIGKNLYCVFIETGLLRKYDLSDLEKVVKKIGLKNVKIVNSREFFLKILKGVIDPEEKRKRIAKLYFEILEEEAKKIGGEKFLGQGTIYPDRIESAATSKYADKIKSHHNVTLPRGLKLKIIEPLADLYKDEVRKIGSLLEIPDEFLNRHPFPGPGLAIRVLGEVTEQRLKILREADNIFMEELKSTGLYNYNKEARPSTVPPDARLAADGYRQPSTNIGQALAALLPIKSVGVMGDARTYSYIIALRSVDTVDFMTADWSKLPNDLLEKVSSRIVNEVRGVNRVVYDITQKPPATIEYE